MKRAVNRGFTLIELVTVIVILGILAAVAVPQFVDLSSSARTAVGNASCGALQTTSIMLFASNNGSSSTFNTIKGATTATGGAFNGSCTAPTFLPTGAATSVSCTALASSFCSG